ncbi:MAG: M28 family peptidase [Myxococcota bacterium]
MWLTWLGCTPERPLPPVVDPLDPGELHDATSALTSIGPRQVATQGEDAARAWFEQRFAALGLTSVVAEPFVFDAWRPGTASVQVDREVPVEALSPSPAADLIVPLRSSTEGFEGAAVLMSSGDGSRADAFLTAATGGAAALIRVTEDIDFDGSPLVEVGHLLDGSTLPAVAVDRGTGDWLESKLGEQVHLRIAPDVALDHTSYNVVGRIAGAGEAGRVYVVGHYDSWHPSESAFDNALGAAAVERLAARALATGVTPRKELVFLATSGEEQGLRGAIAWVAAHEGEVGPADLVLVLDVMWSGEGAYVALATDDGLRTEAMSAAEAEGLEVVDGGQPGIGSDHVPFVGRGASAVWLGRWPDRHYHTVADTIDALSFDEAAAALATHWRLLADHAGLPR